MLKALTHRGPDDEGLWNADGAWLGHRRLAIIDLSPSGRQPMASACGRWLLILNGEIYNYEALRRELGGVTWRGHSDTEVLVECIARHGVDDTLRRTRGMFAFAAWDRESRTAYLARDPMGEKPLCYRASGGEIAFASEVGALALASTATPSLSQDALSLYFRLGYVPAPYAIYDGVAKLPPGSLLTWSNGALGIKTYTSVAACVEAGRSRPLPGPAEAVDDLDALLRQAVGDQMAADVPLGAFLSGGVDSSLVVAIMQSISPRPVETFTLGFDSPEFDEGPYAAEVAAHLGTRHVEHRVSDKDAQAIAPTMGAVFDEPFADPSQIPTWLISRMARERVTVCLTGDGGDEVFGGYVRYPGALRLWDAFGGLPGRRALAGLVERAPLDLFDAAQGMLAPVMSRYAGKGRLGPNLRKAAGWLGAPDFEDLFERTMAASAEPFLLCDSLPRAETWRPTSPAFATKLEWMMWRDAVDYLPGDILCKVDRCAMANSLETRAPLLDPRLADFAARAPADMKIRHGEGKWLLRQVLDRYVPRPLIERPKRGFSVPLHAWLTGGLRTWAEALLEPGRLREQALVEPVAALRVWRRYLAGDTALEHRVWRLLMLQSWLAARER